MLGHLADLTALVTGRGVHLGALAAVLAERYGDRRALEDPSPTPGLHPGGARTFAEVEAHVARLASAHRELGRRSGEHVLLLIGNRIDIILHSFALARVGAVPVPVNARLKPHEVAAVVMAAGASVAVTDADVMGRLREVDELSDLTWVATGDDGSDDSLAGWLHHHPDASLSPPDDADPGATALLLATSGTTGQPKAAALTSRGLLTALGRLAAAPVGWRIGPRSGRDLMLAALPLTHIMGIGTTLGALCAGIPMLHRPRFDAEEVLTLIEDRDPNVFTGVPTMYADLEAAGAADRELGAIQLWVSAADVMPPDRARRFQSYGAAGMVRGKPRGTAAFADIYGMVELSGGGAVRLYPPSPLRRVQVPAVAITLPGMEVRAVDEDGEPVGYGKVGELEFRGSGVLQRYEGRDDAGPRPDGWFPSGDYGRVWPSGFFAFSGRRHDRLKVGGFSVFPAEVEEALRSHPAIRDVAVVGVPDERLGDRPVALVVPATDDADPDAILAWARREVAGYRRPTEVLLVEDLPRGNHGKLDRRTATQRATDLTGARTEVEA
ncbi:MAG: acyl--CoA ligase [Actinobacteria bacterium]|nr:acyl--CoA ligase [Actinomycetota bacterium]